MIERKAMRRDWDYWNTIDYARKEGRDEGKAEEQHRIAKRLLAAGVSAELVAESTGLSVGELCGLAVADHDGSGLNQGGKG